MPFRRPAAVILAAGAVLLGSLAVAPASASANAQSYFDDFSTYVDDYGKWLGGFSKDWTEGKAGGVGDSWKFSDTKKYGLITGTATLMSLLSLSLPDPATEFRNQMLEELDKLVVRLTDLVNQVSEMLGTAEQIIEEIDNTELSLATDTVNDIADSILDQYNREGYESYTRYGRLFNDNEANFDDPYFMADFDEFMRALGGRISGRQQSLHTAVLVYMSDSYLPILEGRYETTAEAELPYYTAALAPALYYDSASAAGAQMLTDHYTYMANVDPANETWWASRATTAIESHLDFRRALYGMVGAPVGNENYDVVLDEGTWKLIGSADDPRREWYGMGQGRTEVELTDFAMSSVGRPTINSAVWHLSTSGIEVDEDDPDARAATIEVYNNGVLVDTIDDFGFAFPGPDATEVTLASSREEAMAAPGWALAPITAPGGAPFARWSADADVDVTTTVDVDQLGWSFFGAVFEYQWSSTDIQVDGDGDIEVWEEGELITTIARGAGEPATMLTGQKPTQLHLTTDRDVAEDPDVLMALRATGSTLIEWSPTLGTGEQILDVEPGDVVAISASMELVDEVTLDVDLDGPGTVEAYRDGQLEDALAQSGPLLVRAGEVTFTSNPNEIPDEGWAVLANTGGNAFNGWNGAVTGTNTQIVDLAAYSTHSLAASFTSIPVQVDVFAGPNGAVEVYDGNGNYLDTVTGGSATFMLHGHELVVTSNRSDLPTSQPALLAVADEHYTLESWSGAASGAETQTVILSPGGGTGLRSDFSPLHYLNLAETFIGGTAIEYGVGVVALSDGRITSDATNGYWYGGITGGSFNGVSFSFDVLADGTLINGAASGELGETVPNMYCGPVYHPYCGGNSNRHQITGATGHYDDEGGRLTVHFSSNGGPDNTAVFDVV
ncbi:MAG: hypothetical protein AAGF73_00560 [Actinomycetota bacterium]